MLYIPGSIRFWILRTAIELIEVQFLDKKADLIFCLKRDDAKWSGQAYDGNPEGHDLYDQYSRDLEDATIWAEREKEDLIREYERDLKWDAIQESEA